MPLSTQDLKDIIINDATRLGNDPALMLALADHESIGFNPNALSPTGVRGLFQVTNKTGAPYGQTPQTRSDPTVSSDVGQRHFKDLLHKAGGNVDTALGWYNGGSDPQFAKRVQAKVAGHRASLTAEPSLDELHQAVYGATAATPTAATPDAEPSLEELHQAVYGPPPAAPGPMQAPDGPLPPSDFTLDIEKTSPDSAPPEGAFARYTGKPDLPLEESLSPLELGISGVGAKVGLSTAKYLWPTAGRLVQLGAQGLGLEVGHKVNQAVGNTPGSLTDFGWPDVANFVTPLVQEGVVQAMAPVLRAGRAGQAVRVADTATAAERTAYETTLAEAEAAHTAQVAADRMRYAAGGGRPPVTAEPQTLLSLRATPPTAVQPTLQASGADRNRRLGEIGTGILSAVYSGHPGKSLLGGAAVAAGDKGYEAFSRWLLSPKHLPAFREYLGPSGTLDPRKMAVLYGLFTSGQELESPPP